MTPDLILDHAGEAAIPGAGHAALTLRLEVVLPRPEEATARELAVLLDAGGGEVLRVALRRSGADMARRGWDDTRENLPRFADASGTTAVLEAVCAVAARPPMRTTLPTLPCVGVPLALVGPGPHAVEVRVHAARLELLLDGRLVDEEWTCGGPAADPRRLRLAAGTAQVWRAARDDTPDRGGEAAGILRGADLQYWKPSGHNRWAGDTMLFHDGGRLHLMYLIDRRHHGSKGFCGAHQVAHLSTADLRTWESHPLVVGVDEPWEAIGTGSMVKRGSQWCFVYGLHSERCVGDASAGAALPQPFAAIAGTPAGTAIAVSDDGVHFRKLPELVHAAQNPSVIADPAGGYLMFAGEGAYGLYRSDDLRSWRAVDHAVVPHGHASPWRNTCECMCHLEWNGIHYLWGGFTGFWAARDIAGPYWDQDDAAGTAVVAALRAQHGDAFANPRPPGTALRLRHDIYDGLGVPMAATMPDGRRILCGWLSGLRGWGGRLVLRELLQEADGTLGLRWLPEAVPEAGAGVAPAWDAGVPAAGALLSTSVELPAAWLLDCEIDARGAPVSLIVGGVGALDGGVELRLDPRRGVAQWGVPRAGAPAPDLRGQMAELAAMPRGSHPYDRPSPHLAFKAADFAIDGVAGLDRPFRLRLLALPDRATGGAILDAEIDGRRTLITRRDRLDLSRLQVLAAHGVSALRSALVRPVERWNGADPAN